MRLRVGIVCPYSFDVPGGVQFHIRDLAESLVGRGHEVQVLAPAEDETAVPDYLTTAGRTVPVRYNGSVARVSFGPANARRVRRWLDAGDFDLLHLHEPLNPSLALLALWNASGPVVATFHSSQARSRALQFVYPMVRPALERLSARIAVSEDARRTVVEHVGGDAVIVPNGVFVDRFTVAPDPRWTGTPTAPTFAFLGRLDEPRKGLQVLVGAVPRVLAEAPGARFLIAGRGEDGKAEALAALGPHARAVEFLGGVSDADKAALLASADAYVAPQTGGESFGIVLVEAMAAGTTVVASDLGAFRRVLAEGEAGLLFRSGDPADLGRALLRVVRDPEAARLARARASAHVWRYDWSTVTDQVLTVYEMAMAGAPAKVSVTDEGRFPRPWRTGAEDYR